jgi:PAS domain S-box-containing protein
VTKKKKPGTQEWTSMSHNRQEMDALKTELATLRESETRYRRLFESAKDGILILNAETGVINDVNPFLMEILGYSREQFIGASIWELGFIKNIVANKENFEILQSRKYIRYEDMPLETDDGRRIDVEFVSNVYVEGNNKVIQCNIRDITERKRMEKELNQYRDNLEELVKQRANELINAQEQLIHSQKMEAVGQLASGISHDFNNMLAVILGASELVLSKLKPDDPNHARMLRVIKSGMRAKKITGRLLTFARKEKLEISYASIRNIFQDTMEILTSSVSKKIKIQTSVSEDDLVICGDVNQLEQALLNICLNACDAMKEGGKLTLEAAPISLDDNFCKTRSGLKPGDYCLIQIRDEGHGIPADMINKIFEPFFTTKQKSEGAGLGLSVTEGIVKTHNGLIEVESEPGKGTNVRVYLPAAKDPTAACRAEPDGAARQRKRENILIIDDEKDFTDMMADILIEHGYNPIAANSGKEAIEIYQKSKDDIDLAILDIMMPDMDGGEVFTAMRRIRHDVKVILCSGFSVQGKAMDILNRGAFAFIQKPYDIHNLLKTISDTLMM